MALTSTTSFDIVGQTQTITFFQGITQLDQIIYSGNTVNFQAISTYNLVKSDLLLYIKFLNIYYNLLITNFAAVASSQNANWPLSVFNISETNVGVLKIIYNQTTGANTVLNINYVPIAGSAAIASRGSTVSITNQEFFMTNNMLLQYSNQVSFN